MKRFLIILGILFIGKISIAQQLYYSDFISSMELITDTCWTDWSEWQQYYTEIEINKDSIVVYDNDVYYIYQQTKDSINNIIVFKTTNQQGDTVQLRFRTQDFVKQLYIDLKNKIWVYNLN